MRLLLSFILSFTLINLAHAQPNSSQRFIQVSPEEMKTLLKDPTIQRYAQVKTIEKDKDKKEDEEPADNDVHAFIQGISFDGNNEAALIIFAVVGIVVIVAWIPYFAGVTYQLIKGEKDSFQLNHLVSGQFTQLTTDRDGILAGGRYSLFVNPVNDRGAVSYGLSFESGYYESQEKNKNGKRELNHGAYWMTGPTILAGEGSLFGKIDLLAGSSFDRNLGLISKAEASLNWLFDSGLTLGASIGGLYFHVKDRNGILKHENDLGFTYGVVSGFSF